MPGAPLVTVAIPTVSRIDYLRDALESVVMQTYRSFEVVVSENSGDERYGNEVNILCASFPQIKSTVLHQSPQLSMPENANALLRAAKGTYWVYLPDDDRLGPQFLVRSVAALETHPEAAFSFSDHWVMHSDGRRDEALSEQLSALYGRARLAERFYTHDELAGLAARQSFHLQSMLLRLSAVGRAAFDPRDTIAPDLGLQFKLATDHSDHGAVFLAERLVDYRVHVAQFTRTTSSAGRARAYLDTVERFRSTALGRHAAFRAILGRGYLELGSRELDAGRRAPAALALARSAVASPSIDAVGKLLLVSLPRRAARGALGLYRAARSRAWF